MKKIIGLMANIGCGGAEVQSILLFNGLSKKGYKVKVIVLDNVRTELSDRLDKSIKVEFIKRNFYFDPLAILKVKRLIQENNPDFFIMVDNYPILYGIILRSFLGQKLNSLIILHNTIPPNIKRALQNRLIYGPAINRLDKVVFVCNEQKKYWVDKYSINVRKASVILNGIDIEYFEKFYLENNKLECREKVGIPTDSVVIAINASLWAAKSHEHMIEAMYKLKKEGIILFLLIIGDGPRRKYLEDLSLKMEMSQQVLITGYVEDIRPYLMCADICALTSVTETLSMAAIEGMALGKALILSNTGGAPEIVEEGVNGYLYTPGNIDELVISIKKIIGTEKYLNMGEKSREKAKKLFAHKRMISQYIKLLEGFNREIINNSRKKRIL